MQDGWPETIFRKDDQLKPYFDRRLCITVHKGVLIWQADTNRVVIPASLQKKIMNQLHQGHFGIARMKQLARRYCWWPKINADILVATKHCDACQANQVSPRQIYQLWPEPERPWERIHIDCAGPF